jgi:chromosome partitioning protein
MLTIAVLNAKGGCGKTTIATNLAAWFSLQGYRTALGDMDAQRSSRYWLARRPNTAAEIESVKLHKQFREPTKKTSRFVIDGAAAMDRGEVKDVIAQADVILVPILPSTYDQEATRVLLERVADIKRVRKGKRHIAFVANRIRPRTRNAAALETFLAEQPFPTIGRLRDTQIYSNAADSGLSIFETREARAKQYAEEWAGLTAHLEALA